MIQFYFFLQKKQQQSKGSHDHPRPEPKSSNSEMKRLATLKALKNSTLQHNLGYIRKYNKVSSW